jgi:hypothetical protein
MSIWGAPLYYPYASWFYPPFGAGIYLGFGAGINMGFYFGGGWGGGGGWGWQPGWGGRNIIVNNNFIHRYNFNAGRTGSLSGRSTWAHDASHRQGVPYSNSAVSQRFGGSVRQNLQTRAPAQQTQAHGALERPGPNVWATGKSHRAHRPRIAALSGASGKERQPKRATPDSAR